MRRLKSLATVLAAGTFLAGCSVAADALWPSLTGEDPAPSQGGQQTAIPQSAAERNPSPTLSAAAPPRLGSSSFVPQPVTTGQTSGTHVGQKIGIYRGELQRLQSDINQQNGRLQQIRALTAQNSQAYHSNIGSINARLQVGTTPGNPALVGQWNAAQAALATIDNDIAQMNALANDVAGTSTLSAYLLETTRATYGLSGAVEEDHRQLAILEDEVNRTVVLIDRLLNELSEDISRQTNYVANERANLTTLAVAIKNGELLGSSLSNRAFATASPSPSRAAPAIARSGLPGSVRRPLVVIRFDRQNVQYEQALYTAVSRALERRPNAMFDLVAVAPSRGSAAQVTVASNRAKRSAEQVLRSLSDMGLPADRVRLSALTSGSAQSNEVHVYVR